MNRQKLETIRDTAISLLADLPPDPPKVPLTYPSLRSDREVATSATPIVFNKGDLWKIIGYPGSTLTRVTDKTVADRSCGTPSSSHVSAWSCDSAYYYVRTTPGEFIVFRASDNTEDYRVGFSFEPTYSLVEPGVLIGMQGTSVIELGIDEDRTVLLAVNVLPGWPLGGVVGTLVSSAGPVEKIALIYGGTRQDTHNKCAVFERQSPTNRVIIDTDQPAYGFKLHGMALDKSGRWLLLYPEWQHVSRTKVIGYYVDLHDPTKPPRPMGDSPNGHACIGYNASVNQESSGDHAYDAFQWQCRQLHDPDRGFDLVEPLRPKLVYAADHSSWHNAQADGFVPVCSATYRYNSVPAYAPIVERRAWDNEVLLIATDKSGTVWRVGPHYSQVEKPDGRIIYWASPRPQIAPNGRSILFTSNLLGTLGPDLTDSELGGFRTDCFRYDC